MTRFPIRNVSAAVAALALSSAVFAQDGAWPSHPIVLVVAASAGSGPDLAARELADRLSKSLKQPIVVDNKPGASGVVATQQVVRAKPDGYTLLYTTATNTVVAPAVKKMPYDVTKDLAPVAEAVAGGVFLTVSNDLPVKNLPDLVKLVKANPGKYVYGSWAIGSSGQLTMEWLKRKTGMDIGHVPYRQTTQMLTELSTGTLKIGFADPAAPLPFIQDGRIKAIAVTGTKRLPRAPEVPTFGEQGFDFKPVGWFGVLAPAKTPEAIVNKLNAEIRRIQNEPDMIAKTAALNVSPSVPNTPAQFHDSIVRDLKMWQEIVKDAGITME